MTGLRNCDSCIHIDHMHGLYWFKVPGLTEEFSEEIAIIGLLEEIIPRELRLHGYSLGRIGSWALNLSNSVASDVAVLLQERAKKVLS